MELAGAGALPDDSLLQVANRAVRQPEGRRGVGVAQSQGDQHRQGTAVQLPRHRAESLTVVVTGGIELAVLRGKVGIAATVISVAGTPHTGNSLARQRSDLLIVTAVRSVPQTQPTVVVIALHINLAVLQVILDLPKVRLAGVHQGLDRQAAVAGIHILRPTDGIAALQPVDVLGDTIGLRIGLVTKLARHIEIAALRQEERPALVPAPGRINIFYAVFQ